jgi:hypothetical protein
MDEALRRESRTATSAYGTKPDRQRRREYLPREQVQQQLRSNNTNNNTNNNSNSIRFDHHKRSEYVPARDYGTHHQQQRDESRLTRPKQLNALSMTPGRQPRRRRKGLQQRANERQVNEIMADGCEVGSADGSSEAGGGRAINQLATTVMRGWERDVEKSCMRLSSEMKSCLSSAVHNSCDRDVA